jgi:Glycosyl transferases group 1.
VKKVLFITSADLMKTYNSGGEHECWNNIHFLKEIYGEQNVSFLFFSEWKGEFPKQYYVFPRLRRWKALFAQLLGYKMYFPWNEKRILKSILMISPDIIFFDGVLVGNLLSKISKDIYTIVFEHNCEKKYYTLRMKHEGLIYAIEYWSVSRCEKIAVSECSMLICINERDRLNIFKIYSREADLLLPVSFENKLCKNKIKKNNSKEIVFIGSNFGPNLQGIAWFVENVMSCLPDFKLYIVGKDFEKDKEYLERRNVIVVGTVDNIEDIYYHYSIVVMPIFYGSGMKVKTAEAMMYGRTILATDEALEGYDIEGVNGIFRCNTQEEYINVIIQLFKDDIPEFREEVHQKYLEKYSNGAALDTLRKALPTGEKYE